jgi:putative ABC transport system ATP-binding protein
MHRVLNAQAGPIVKSTRTSPSRYIPSPVVGLPPRGTSIDESCAKFDMAAWLEEIAKCPHTFRFGRGGKLALDRADGLAAAYVAARKRHFSVVWRQTLFALLLEAVGSTVLLGLGGWLVINRQLTLG